MITETFELAGSTPGQQTRLKVLRFGTPGAGPKAVIQAALHADETPALLVAQHLRERLSVLEAEGRVSGEVVLVPYANPIGLAQQVLGHHEGRFHLRDGVNFNRLVPDVSAAAAQRLQGRLGSDAPSNTALAREALREAAAALTATQPAEDLKRRLIQLAVDADIVFDLHCDGESTLHLYGLTPQADQCAELGALLGAEAILLATESGDSPFDEACSRPWFVLQQQFPAHPLPLGCFATTVELRGQADVDDDLAARDAAGLIAYLTRHGVLQGASLPLPEPRCVPTPLAASEPVIAPIGGVVVFRCAVGSRIKAGDTVAEIVDVDSGQRWPILAQSSGVLYARVRSRWAAAGDRLGKIAGTTLARTGKLLSA
ncbi:MAG: succinylglutamate desuccinylase/aspartoacylase family protein [Rubrivivax sp.]|nr:succinylglutamate desuccinylase/aspartoacylase family protein [Rubrivivax sp.]